jgi:hypothetical protein
VLQIISVNFNLKLVILYNVGGKDLRCLKFSTKLYFLQELRYKNDLFDEENFLFFHWSANFNEMKSHFYILSEKFLVASIAEFLHLTPPLHTNCCIILALSLSGSAEAESNKLKTKYIC